MSDPSEQEREETVGPDHPGQRYEDGIFDTVPDPPKPPKPPATERTVDGEYGDVDPALRKHFWRLVLLIKFTLLSLTLGILFLVFEEQTALGWQIAAVGLFLAGYTVYQYRKSTSWIESGDFDRSDENRAPDESTPDP